MQYKPETEKVAMMDPSDPVTIRPLSLKYNVEIQRTRKILLIILGVCLGLSIAGALSAISTSAVRNEIGSSKGRSEVGFNIISILFYAFGTFVAYRYYQIGLRIFAIIGVIILVLEAIAVILLLLLGVVVLTALSQSDAGEHKGMIVGASFGAFFVIFIVAASFILTVIIVKFAFKLARLIDANKYLMVQSV
ncbi:hypothetical protein I4U23_011820 [Adineta vaga]|nr:hypothetical protein I4U23_011820 [Adineta vaga]